MRNRTLSCSAAVGVALFGLGLLLGVGSLPGCGRTPGERDASSKSERPGPAGKSASPRVAGEEQRRDSGNAGEGTNAVARRGVYVKDGQKWWNKHPYDIWYQDAYKIASDTRPVGTSGNPPKIDNKQPAPPTGKKKGPPPKSQGGWKGLVPVAELETEVKNIRNFLALRVRTPGVYKTAYKQIEYNGAVLAALASVIAVHPDEVSWKQDALYVRDLGLKISESATGIGIKNYRATKLAYEQFADILSRNKPAGLAEPKKNESFFDFASRGGLMKRMEQAYNWLDKEVPTAGRFKEEQERVRHEAAVLRVLLTVIGDASYDQADAPGYKKHVAESVKLTRQITAAAQNEDFAGYRQSLSAVYNHCNQCHTEFRGQ